MSIPHVRIHSGLALVAGLCLAAPAMAASGGHPMVVSHSGFLVGSGDVPVDGAAVSLGFRLIDRSAPVAGETRTWEATCPVAVRRGHFEVVLGGTECPGNDLLDTADLPFSSPRWLELVVEGTVLSPRLAVTSVPSAMHASTAGDTDTLAGHPPSDFAAAVHTHVAAEVTDLASAAVAAAVASGAFAPTDHTHGLASASSDGFLSAADWVNFASKVAVEADPRVGPLEAGKWCTSDGTKVTCTSDAPGGSTGLVPGTYTNAAITVDAQGRISSVTQGLQSPVAFTFASVSGAAVSTNVTSAIAFVTGINGPQPVSVTGGSQVAWRACTDATCSTSPAFSSAAGSIANNTWLQLRVTTAGSVGVGATVSVTVGGYTTTWSVSTTQPGTQEYTSPGTFTFTVPAGVTSIQAIVVGGGGGGGSRSGAGLPGGTSQVTGFVSATGGAGGGAGATAGGTGGTGSSADVTYTGGSGGAGGGAYAGGGGGGGAGGFGGGGDGGWSGDWGSPLNVIAPNGRDGLGALSRNGITSGSESGAAGGTRYGSSVGGYGEGGKGGGGYRTGVGGGVANNTGGPGGAYGGGGGGAGGNETNSGGGGGGGGYARRTFAVSGGTLTVVVGAGGLGHAAVTPSAGDGASGFVKLSW